MHFNAIDLTGHVYANLTVLIVDPVPARRTLWICKCACGAIVSLRGDILRRGINKSCGCYRAERLTTHGMRAHPLYSRWKNMRDRCLRPKNKRFSHYGGRGITVCDRWLEGEGGKTGFECFVEDMGLPPTPLHTVDRKDNDGNYEPGNCRWATKREQSLNRRPYKHTKRRGKAS